MLSIMDFAAGLQADCSPCPIALGDCNTPIGTGDTGGRPPSSFRLPPSSFIVALLLGGMAMKAHGAPLVAETEPLAAQEQQRTFHLPPNFEIQLIAAEPQIQKPMNLNFDARGSLYVTGSVEYPFPAKPGTRPRDCLKRIDDADGDGVPETVRTVAEGLNIPIGVVPVADGVLCYSIPSIDRLVDADGDGRADERQRVYGEFGSVDTHGMTNSFNWWIDGWIYATHGFKNSSTVRGSTGQPITMESGNTYRMRPDGTRVEHFTFGQVNPFGLAFDPLGNVYTADCHTKPAYLLLRGAWYPSFSKPHDGLGFGPTLMEHSHGSTGIAGIAYYAADQFPEAYRGTLFVGNPVTGRINHDRIEAQGSTYRAIELPDFLSCDDPWFRPVDLRLAPDGSLYIADFYNRIIGHYEVPLVHPGRDRERGRIWRVVYKGTAQARTRPMPDLTGAAIGDLVSRLGDPNLVVRTLATHELVGRGEAAAGPVRAVFDSRPSEAVLATEEAAWPRVHGIWVLERLGRLEAELLARVAADLDRAVRVHAVKVLAERQWQEGSLEHRLALAGLADPDPFVQRAAAEALGRHPSAGNEGPLLKCWEGAPAADTHLIHVLRMALRDTLAAQERLSLVREDARESDRLADVALGIRTAAAGEVLLDFVATRAPDHMRAADFFHHSARYGASDLLPRVFEVAEHWRNRRERGRSDQEGVLRALDRALRERGEKMPSGMKEWGERLACELLGSDSADEAQRGAELARQLELASVAEDLVRLAGRDSPHATARMAALEALAGIATDRRASFLGRVLADPSEPFDLRRRAAELLGGLNESTSRGHLLANLRLAPAAMALPIARAIAQSREGAHALLADAERGTVSARLLQDRTVDQRIRSALPKAGNRLAKLSEGLPPAETQVAQLLASRRDAYQRSAPDAQRGTQTFAKICAACHRLGGQGKKIGPDLDGIGQRGVERLLEDILDPSRNVDQAFRASVLSLGDGQVLTGLVLRQEGESVVFVDEGGKERLVPTSEVAGRRTTLLSPMPADIAQRLPEAELFDLVSFLLTAVPAPAGE